jgi:acetate kinase
MKPILVINSGSSSLKYQVIDTDGELSLLSGAIERVSDHGSALREMAAHLEDSGIEPVAVAHRVVHGGERFSAPVVVTPDVEEEIEGLVPLAPLHNPGNLAGIRAARQLFPKLVQVAVFDTAFHQSMPGASYRYAIDREVADRFQIRRYGFHGSSHSYVRRRAASHLGIEPKEFNAISLHLGNGASVCAVRGGKSFDTSMGLTPLEGLVMGTRSGNIDPAIVFYLMREGGMSAAEVDELLNKRSGMLGLTGLSDFRDITNAAESGDRAAQLALEIFTERVRQYIGGYLARLGRVDAIIFTAGVGEHSAPIRASVCADLGHLGIELDESANQAATGLTDVAKKGSQIRILVVPTNEELEIALGAAALI